MGAIVIWIIGTWLIRFGTNVLRRALIAKKIDITLVTYIAAGVPVLLRVILTIAIFDYFGVLNPPECFSLSFQPGDRLQSMAGLGVYLLQSV